MPGENLTRNDLLSRMYFSDTVVMLPDGSLKAIDSVVGLNRFQTVYQFFRKSDLKQITTKTLHSNLLASRYRLNETIVYLISQFIGYLQFYDKDIFETERENKETIQVKYQESIKEYLQEIVGLPETSAEFQEYYQAFLTGRPDYLKLNQLLTKNLSTLYQQRLEARIKNLNGMLKEVKTIASQLASTTTIQQNLMPQLDRLVESQWTKPVVKACIADPKLKIFLLSNFPSLNKPFGNGIGTVVNIFMGQAELDGSADTDSHAIMVYVDDKSSYWPTHATLLGEYLIDLPPEVQALPQLVEYRTHSFHSTIAVLTEELSDYSASKLRQDPQYAAEYGQMLNDFHDILNNFDQTNARRDIQVAMEIIKNEGDVNVLKTKEKKDIWKEIKKFVMGIIKNSHPLPRTRIRMIEDNAIREGQSYTIKNWTEYKATYVIEKILATVNIAGKNWSVALMVAPAMSTDSSEWTDLDIAELCVTLLNIYGQSYGAKKAGYSPEIYVPEMRGALLKIISEYPGFARSVTSKHWSSELGKFYRDFHELVEKAAVYPEEKSNQICINDVCFSASIVTADQLFILNRETSFFAKQRLAIENGGNASVSYHQILSAQLNRHEATGSMQTVYQLTDGRHNVTVEPSQVAMSLTILESSFDTGLPVENDVLNYNWQSWGIWTMGMIQNPYVYVPVAIAVALFSDKIKEHGTNLTQWIQSTTGIDLSLPQNSVVHLALEMSVRAFLGGPINLTHDLIATFVQQIKQMPAPSGFTDHLKAGFWGMTAVLKRVARAKTGADFINLWDWAMNINPASAVHWTHEVSGTMLWDFVEGFLKGQPGLSARFTSAIEQIANTIPGRQCLTHYDAKNTDENSNQNNSGQSNENKNNYAEDYSQLIRNF